MGGLLVGSREVMVPVSQISSSLKLGVWREDGSGTLPASQSVLQYNWSFFNWKWISSYRETGKSTRNSSPTLSLFSQATQAKQST